MADDLPRCSMGALGLGALHAAVVVRGTQRAGAGAGVACRNAVRVVILVRRGHCWFGEWHWIAVRTVEHLVDDEVALLIQRTGEAVGVVEMLNDQLFGVGSLFLFHVDVCSEGVDEIECLSTFVAH